MSDRKLIYCDDAMAAVDKRIAELSQHEAFQRKSALSAVIDVAGVKKHIANIPSADAVSRGVYDQVMWERDIAIQQLESIGKSFGEQMDNVVMIDMSYWKHEYIEGVDSSWGKPGRTYCAKCGGGGSVSYRFCPWCGRKITKVEPIHIIRDGDMWDDEL